MGRLKLGDGLCRRRKADGADDGDEIWSSSSRGGEYGTTRIASVLFCDCDLSFSGRRGLRGDGADILDPAASRTGVARKPKAASCVLRLAASSRAAKLKNHVPWLLLSLRPRACFGVGFWIVWIPAQVVEQGRSRARVEGDGDGAGDGDEIKTARCLAGDGRASEVVIVGRQP
jgi:hypothetical protein